MPNLNEILQSGSESFRRLNRGAAGKVPAHHGVKATPALPVAAPVPDPQPKSDLGPALDRSAPAQGRGPGPALQRIGVSIHLCRTRLLDDDNKWGSVKPLLDALRYAGLIPEDRASDIALDVTQYKVPILKAEGTGLVLTYPKTYE